MFPYILERAKEPSSWRGLVFLATAAGVNIAPDLTNAIISAGMSIAGLIGVLTADKNNAAK